MRTYYMHLLDGSPATVEREKGKARICTADPTDPPCHGPAHLVKTLRQIRKDQKEHVQIMKGVYAEILVNSTYEGSDLGYIRVRIPE